MCINDRPQYFMTRSAVSNESMNAHRWKRMASTLFAVTSAKWHKRMQFRFPLARNLLPLVNFASSLTLPFRCERQIVLLHFVFSSIENAKKCKMAIIFFQCSFVGMKHMNSMPPLATFAAYSSEWAPLVYGLYSVQVERPPMNAYFKCPNVFN